MVVRCFSLFGYSRVGVPVIVLAAVQAPPVDTTLLELTLRATDATPENVILYPRPSLSAAGLFVVVLTAMGISDSWPRYDQVLQGIVWYQNGVKYVGNYSAGGPSPAVFPVVGDVDLGTVYGPTGADYTGTLKQPAITDVLSGVQYGAGGTEFTGTASSGVSGVLLDVDTNNLFETLNGPFIHKL